MPAKRNWPRGLRDTAAATKAKAVKAAKAAAIATKAKAVAVKVGKVNASASLQKAAAAKAAAIAKRAESIGRAGLRLVLSAHSALSLRKNSFYSLREEAVRYVRLD